MRDYAKMLKEHSLKATFQRMTILSALDTMGHANIEEIYETVLKTHPTISLATVYKNILTMVQEGVVVEVPISGGKSKYELKREEHLHLICKKCGSVSDMPMQESIKEETEKIARSSSFKPFRRQINIYGICRNCRDI